MLTGNITTNRLKMPLFLMVTQGNSVYSIQLAEQQFTNCRLQD